MSSPRGIAILGAGGHAKVVISTLRAAGVEIGRAFDDSEQSWGLTILKVPILGSLDQASSMGFHQAIIAIGDNAARRRIAEKFDFDWIKAIHPTAWIDPSVTIGPGSVVFAGAVIQPDTRIGRHVIVNTSASIDHDCVVEDYAHIAPGVNLAGNVSTGKGTLLGIGTSFIPGVKIGDGTVVGAGAVVVSDVNANDIVKGVPARSRSVR